MIMGKNYFSKKNCFLKNYFPFFSKRAPPAARYPAAKRRGLPQAQGARRFCRKAAMRRQPYGGRRGKSIFIFYLRFCCLRRSLSATLGEEFVHFILLPTAMFITFTHFLRVMRIIQTVSVTPPTSFIRAPLPILL